MVSSKSPSDLLSAVLIHFSAFCACQR